MAKIKVTAGLKGEKRYAIVDRNDLKKVSHIKWHDNGAGYVRGRVVIEGKEYHVLLHRYIILGDGAIENGNDFPVVIDHINHDTYDNRRYNLRIATRRENSQNRIDPYVRIPEGFLSANDAAKFLGYNHTSSMNYLDKKGRIKKYKVCGTPCYKISELEEYRKPK